ncbi:uncharacterized protein LOC129738485 [Uranotaenia lowii]|uniref:uncharacterized protein LOC129738485 n=1 Tax=Uranotaenia lowii TaxID=190385 RepID=UPI002479DDB5|nr:uncharacterized protein LOC129738485 [Uranotaenia lowii]
MKLPLPKYSWLPVLATWLLLVLVVSPPRLVRTEALTAAGVIQVVHLTKEVVSSILETWDIIEEVGDVHLPFKRNKDEKILKRMYELSQQIQASENQIINNAEVTMGMLIRQLAFESKVENFMQELADLMNRLSHREQLMRSYLESDEKVERLTLEDFARSTVAQDASSVPELLARINLLVAGSKDLPFREAGLLELLMRATYVSILLFIFLKETQTYRII